MFFLYLDIKKATLHLSVMWCIAFLILYDIFMKLRTPSMFDYNLYHNTSY